MAVAASTLSNVRRAGVAGTFVLLMLNDDPGRRSDLVATAQSAVDTANRAVPPRTVIGCFTTLTIRGVVVAVFSNATEQDVNLWLSALAAELERVGFTGKIAHTRFWDPAVDSVIHASDGQRFPAAFVGYSLSDYPPRADPFRGWQVDPKSTTQICDRLQRWLASLDEAWATTGYGAARIQADAVGPFLTAAAEVSQLPKLVCGVAHDRSACRNAALGELGTIVTQQVDAHTPWHDLLDAQVEQLVLAPELADVGLIKNLWALPGDWASLDIRGDNSHRTVRMPLDYESNRHLWDEFVIDAAGVNLLTSKHLKHARDLSDWDVDEVAPDRFLVKAKDLTAWFGQVVPSDEVITRARADFGDMILTWDTIVARPGPYSVTDPLIVGR